MADDAKQTGLSDLAVPQAFVEQLAFSFPQRPESVVAVRPAVGTWMTDSRLYVQVVVTGLDKEGEKQLDAMCTVFTDKPAQEALEAAYPFMVTMCLAKARAALQTATSFGNAEPILLAALPVELPQARLNVGADA